MRKLISLLVAIVVVMGLATVAFAATDAGEHTVEAKADVPTTITLAPGEVAVYNFPGRSEAAMALSGVQVKLSGDKPGAIWVIRSWEWGGELNEENGYTYVTDTNIDGSWGGAFEVENTGTENATYTFEVMPKPGSVANPVELAVYESDIYPNNGQTVSPEMDYEYHYTYTAGETAEVLTIENVELNYNAINIANVNFNIMMTRDDNAEVSLWSEAGYAEEIYMPLAAGQTVIVSIRAQELEPTNSYPTVAFKATTAQVTEISMAGDYVVEDTEAWYAVNSMLAGYIIAVQGDEASIMVDGVVVPAVDGIATAVLNGEGAVILVKVSNATDMIILPAPTEISAAGDYKATVAAGAEVEYAINSKLAGAILTVKGEGAYILIGTTTYEAVDGVATAILEGTGATIPVKVGNAGEASAEYELNIAYLPTSINIAGETKISIGAGAEVAYSINSKLDGLYVTVKGEGAYLIVNDKKIEGKNGVVSTVLEAKGATISLIVGNAGAASAEYTMTITTNPATGDFGVIAAVVAMAVSTMGGVAIVAKKKEN